MSIDPKQFRHALGSFATGITIVTTRDGEGHDLGMTANSFNSVSLDPPMILWSLAKNSYSLPAFMAAEHFAVHILGADQEALSNQFARRGADKFSGVNLARGKDGIPLLEGCTARFECRTAFRYEGGDHVIFVGEVLTYDHSPRAPLLYHGGGYALALPLVKDTPDATHESTSEPDSSFSQDFLIYLLGRAHHQLFLELRRDLQRFSLNEEGWFVLSLLALRDLRSLAELNELLAYTGKRISYDLMASLANLDLVQLQGAYDPQVKASLTPHGRQVVIELVSATKALESHAIRNLDAGAQILMKQCLRQLIADTRSEGGGWIPDSGSDE